MKFEINVIGPRSFKNKRYWTLHLISLVSLPIELMKR
jgi:hypothetical protein